MYCRRKKTLAFIYRYCGNIYDACVLAVKFALNQSKLPALIVKSDDEGQIELDFSDNPSDLRSLKTENVPYAVTVNKIGQFQQMLVFLKIK